MMINAAHQMAINYSMRKRDRGRGRAESLLYLPQGILCLPACHLPLPLIVAEWNYSITLLNWIPRIWQGQTRSLLIALKALITVNCFHNIFRQPGKLLPPIEPYLHATCHMPHAWRRPCLTLPPFAAGFGISILLRRVTKYLRTLDVSSTLSSIPKPGILAHNIKR